MLRKPRIFSRMDWDAMEREVELPKINSPVVYVFCMNTHTAPCEDPSECSDTVRRLQRVDTKIHHHIDIRYNFVIGGDGEIYEGRGWGNQGMLPLRYTIYNNCSLVLGFIGEHTEKTLPNEMRNRREILVQYGIQEGFISERFHPVHIFERNSRPSIQKVSFKTNLTEDLEVFTFDHRLTSQ